jgi:tetratricopeptide (TPR) repeat protein
MSLSIDDAALRHAAYYLTVLRDAEERLERGDDEAGLRRFDDDRDQIMHGFRWAAANAERLEEAARLCSAYPYEAELVVYLRLPARTRIAWSSSAADAATLIADDAARAAHLHKLGMALYDVGDLQRARASVEEAVLINRAIDRPEYLASNLGGLGLILAAAGDHFAAVSVYEQALAVYEQIDARWGEGIYRGNLGASLNALGRHGDALVMLESALVMNRSVGDRRSEGFTSGYLSRAHVDVGEPDRALEFVATQLDIAESLGDAQLEAHGTLQRARVFAALGRLDQAHTDARTALSLLEELEDPLVREARQLLAEIDDA